MSDFYYLYDPADTLALAQSIHLANIDGGMSYIIPFANKTGVVDPTDPVSAGLGVIETAIAAGPLHAGGSNDPESNRLTPSQFQGKVSAAQWTAIKAMVKASISQAPPAGWSEASLEAADTTYSVISVDGYNKTNELKTHLFDSGTWHSADLGGCEVTQRLPMAGTSPLRYSSILAVITSARQVSLASKSSVLTEESTQALYTIEGLAI
jgi:hypothetical protein